MTAGHDNCNYDSYPRQLKRQLQPIWDAAGVEWDVRNGGQGGSCGDSMDNQVFCFANTVGTDVDIVHYSWSYFQGVPGWSYEALFRWAAALKNSPLVHALNVDSGATGFKGNKCRSHYGDSKFWGRYEPLGFQVYCPAQAISFTGKWEGHFNGHIGDGMHTFTRYGADEEKERKDSTGVVYRNWHPGPLLFQTVSDTMAYDILLAMEKALADIKNGIAGGVDLRTEYPDPPNLFDLTALGSPLTCDPELCGVEEGITPGCHNWETPTFAKPQIWPLQPDDDMNPEKGLAQEGDTGWIVGKGRGSNHLIPRSEQNLPFCKHLDNCGWIQPKTAKNGGWQTFLLPRLHVGLVAICCCCGKECGKEFLEPGNMEVRFDGKALDVSSMHYFPRDKKGAKEAQKVHRSAAALLRTRQSHQWSSPRRRAFPRRVYRQDNARHCNVICAAFAAMLLLCFTLLTM